MTAKGSGMWWTAARRNSNGSPKESNRSRTQFRPSSKLSRAVVEGVDVERLVVWPQGTSTSPERWALDPAFECAWRTIRRSGCALELTLSQEEESRFAVRFELPQGARCLGLGERYGGLNLRGRSHSLLTLDDPNHTEATDAMYKCIPLLLVSVGAATFGLLLDSPAPQRWDLDQERSGRANVEIYTRRGFSAYVLGPASLPEVVSAYSRLTGRSPLPPRWSLGHQQCRWSYPTEARVREVASEFRKRRIPCDAIVLDIDYLEDYRVFTISRERFPRFERMISDLGRRGFRVLAIVDPGVKRDAKDDAYRDGRKHDVFCRRPDGKLFVAPVWAGPSCFPDFLVPDVRRWWQRHLDFLLSRGIAGVWNDMNEPALFGQQRQLPEDARALPSDSTQAFVQTLPEGSVGHLEVRSLYGHNMARASWDAQTEKWPERRPFVLTRSCYAGMQRYGAVWLGDNKSWFEHLRLSIPMLLNMGLSGVPFCGVDVGGFGGDCDAELLMRWYQVGVFYPFFRNHCAVGQRAQEPWAYGADVEAIIRRLIETRYRLLPYIEQLFAEHESTGAPPMRPLAWHEPGDEIACECDSQFFLGRDILVAPILHRGHTRRAVYLPKGHWHPFDGGEPLRGSRYHDVTFGFGQIPAFIRDGTIVPLADVVQHTAELANASITFRCLGKNARGHFREDDGETRAYQRGCYNEWRLRVRDGCLVSKSIVRGFDSPKRRYFAEIDGKRRSVRLGSG